MWISTLATQSRPHTSIVLPWVCAGGVLRPETGVRDRASYLLQQNKIRFVLTSPLRPEGAIADHIHLHGDGGQGYRALGG